MARRIIRFDPPDQFIAGAIGEPGQRIFHLQAIGGGIAASRLGFWVEGRTKTPEAFARGSDSSSGASSDASEASAKPACAHASAIAPPAIRAVAITSAVSLLRVSR